MGRIWPPSTQLWDRFKCKALDYKLYSICNQENICWVLFPVDRASRRLQDTMRRGCTNRHLSAPIIELIFYDLDISFQGAWSMCLFSCLSWRPLVLNSCKSSHSWISALFRDYVSWQYISPSPSLRWQLRQGSRDQSVQTWLWKTELWHRADLTFQGPSNWY